MQILWEYPLPLRAHPSACHYEGPLLARAGRLFYPTCDFRPELPGPARGLVITLHEIELESGRARTHQFSQSLLSLPSDWSFVETAGRLVFHSDAFVSLDPEFHLLSQVPPMRVASTKNPGRGKLLAHAGRIYFTDYATNTLFCVDPKSEEVDWSSHLGEIGNYRSGDPQLFEGQLACFGNQGLLIFDAETGERLSSFRVPRVDKLYSPIPEGDDLLLGYTNWSVGGVLRLHRSSGKLLWRYRRKFEGPASYCQIWRLGDVVVWVKGSTEIIALDAATGEERWSYSSVPYLYSDVRVVNGDLLFGTAGADGAIHRLDPATGQPRWTHFLKNGCSYFDLYFDSAIVGDFDGYLRRLDLYTGEALDSLDLGAEVVGDVLVAGERVFTVVWGSDEHPPRLVCVSLS